MILELPWPDRRLGQNAQPHWAVKRRVSGYARVHARLQMLSQMNRAGVREGYQGRAAYVVRVTFSAPNRRWDKQNMPELCKAYIDGIADALRVDDHCFQPEFHFAEPGRGVVTFEIVPVEVGA